MARMTREFGLVLIGAGVLTAGSFFWPTQDLEAVANEQANQQVASSNNGGHRRAGGGMMFLWISRGGGVSSAPVAASPMNSKTGLGGGGFGRVGSSFSGGS
jgi:hypothetical protein